MTGGLVAALAAAVLFGVAAIVQARAVRGLGEAHHRIDPRLVLRVVSQPTFVLAVLMNLAGFGLHLVALNSLPLFLAQAAISSSLAVTAVLAVRLLSEHLRPTDWGAVAAVVVGLAMLSFAAGDHATVKPGVTADWVLLAAVAAVVMTSVLLDRTGLHPVLLGGLAGCLFAAVSIAGRLVPGGGVVPVLTSPASYALLLAGASAFLVYSVALQRGHVARVSAPMVAMQTIVPALVGLAFLGDTVRSGYVVAAVLGLAATLGGAVLLGRFEATGHEPVAT
ncbi:hypothetical protein [Solicola sp. PLA-1-18]|uniref:hypothetical protein n=1 Tax=Solicola sp. PLA-1-18 TaxID=3380532 RepID=UPI003B809E71